LLCQKILLLSEQKEYIFERHAGGSNSWGETKKLIASDAQNSDLFGCSVAIDGDIAVVGAKFEDSHGPDAGSAYIFERNFGGSNNWGQVKKVSASDAQANDQFGISVAVNGDFLIVGAPYEDEEGNYAGAAYVFEKNAGGINNWGEIKKLTPQTQMQTHISDALLTLPVMLRLLVPMEMIQPVMLPAQHIYFKKILVGIISGDKLKNSLPMMPKKEILSVAPLE